MSHVFRYAVASAIRRSKDLYWRVAGPRSAYASLVGEPHENMFSSGTRPVIRWVKGEGKDDAITRSAIGQATRLFGNQVDYCLAVNSIGMSRARRVVSWASQPVEILVQMPHHNRRLASILNEAACPPRKYGYWWKWFPPRVRPEAPEWILDGDMVVVGIPSWFQRWRSGKDIVRVTQDDSWESEDMYGRYSDMVDRNLRLYSGLISLPPRLDYMTRMLEILQREPLKKGHDGRVDKSEQGCVAAAFSGIGVEPIPLAEFPFARAFQGHLDYGRRQVKGEPWGYHFGNAFRLNNPHFHRLVKEGRIFWQETEPDLVQRFTWLRDYGQWGRDGWSSIHPEFVKKLSQISRRYSRKRVLELGTSRGFLSAIMAENGCVLTTVDRLDRGAQRNLEGMNAELVTGSALEFLRESSESFSFIVVDIHGNDLKTWKELWPLLVAHLDPGGRMFLHNSHLWMIPEWFDQTGLRWVLETQLEGWATEILPTPAPGLCLVTKPTL